MVHLVYEIRHVPDICLVGWSSEDVELCNLGIMNDRLSFGDSHPIKPNRAYQDVYFDGKLVGWLTSSFKNFLSPIEERFESINLTKEVAEEIKVEGQSILDSEDCGFYQLSFHLDSKKLYCDLYSAAKKIWKSLENNRN